MAEGPNKVVQSSRQVIEHKLLVALDDPETVAILASKDDLDLIIACLLFSRFSGARAKSLASGLKQLRREAFGPQPDLTSKEK